MIFYEYKKTLEYLDSINLSPMLMECYQQHITDIWDVYEKISDKVEKEIGEFSMTFEELVDCLRGHYELYIRENIRYELVPSFLNRGVYFIKKGLIDEQ